jgi:hypothetical protein
MSSNETKKLAICDSDRTYLGLIQAYLYRKNPLDFEILTFSSVKSAIDASFDFEYEIFLVSEGIYSEDVKKVNARKTFILKEDGIKLINEYEMVSKYQSMESLVSEILEKYASDESCGSNIKCGRNRTKIVTFYSPEHHAAQSMTSIAAAQLLADKGSHVLYINLHGFSGFEELLNLNFDADITDFMYFVLKYSDKILYKLEGMKRNIRGVDYLPPALDFEDLVGIEARDWEKVLDLVAFGGDYTHIVVDLSENCQGFYEILDKSDKIYVLYNDNSLYGQASMRHFERLLEAKERDRIIKKLTPYTVPYEVTMNAQPPQNLAACEVGAYMRGVIE